MTAQTYTVYKVKGEVFSMHNATARPLKHGESVSDNTILRINAKSEVWLIEKNRKKTAYRLHNVTGKKGSKVTELVNSARQHTRTRITDINQTIIDNLSNSKSASNNFKRPGISKVVTNANGSKTLLSSMTGPDDFTESLYRPVKVRKSAYDNGLFFFSFKNESDEILYANIILKDCTSATMEFLLPENVILGKGVTDVKDLMFMIPRQPFPGYILILSDKPFTEEDIRNEFDISTQNVSRNYVYEIIR